tara:strand:- start:507 stop:1118 length:612 start_codon:yes stop_codon:yes gene_type:complete
MAYSLYRSAAASPGAFGQGLAALQSAINFRDVKSDAGIKALQEVAINDFVAKSNMAKQALGELGAFNRDQLMVDYYKDRDDKIRAADKKTGKINALLGLLAGSGKQQIPLSFGGFGDVRDQFQSERNFRNAGADYERRRMGGLHPDKALPGMTDMFGSPNTANAISLPKQQVSITEPPKLETAKSTATKQYLDLLRQSFPGKK